MLLIYRKIRLFRFSPFLPIFREKFSKNTKNSKNSKNLLNLRTKTKRDRYSTYVQSKLILMAERGDVANIQKNSIFQIQPFFAQILRENHKKHEKLEKLAKLKDENVKRSI